MLVHITFRVTCCVLCSISKCFVVNEEGQVIGVNRQICHDNQPSHATKVVKRLFFFGTFAFCFILLVCTHLVY